LRGQIVSIDAVISLSLLAAMLVVWGYMYQDASPLFQIYTYRETYLAADHISNVLLFAPTAWRCQTPQNIDVPGCIQKGASISSSDLGLDDLNVSCLLSCSPGPDFSTPCMGTPTSPPAVPVLVRNIRICDGNWDSCTVLDCSLEVWHR